jgi:inner membrane protein
MDSINRINPLLGKIMIIAAVGAGLLFPLHQVESLISERAALRDGAIQRVANGTGRAQQIGALIWVAPVTRTWSVQGTEQSQTVIHHVLASAVDISGSVAAEVRKSGIYEVPTFRAQLHITGSISDAPLGTTLAAEAGVNKQVGECALFLALSDPRGIRSLEGIRISGRLVPVTVATVAGLTGVSAVMPCPDPAQPHTYDFALDVLVSGTQRLQFLPFAQTSHVHLTSNWPSPSFGGAFGPDLAPTVAHDGFSADWQVLQINRDYPQSWTDRAVTQAQIAASAFGVDFYRPVDAYQRDYRAIHYAQLVITLSFIVVFLCEHAGGKRFHPMQYAMIGAALSTFYLVLLSMSEHMPFGRSYALAGAAMTLLIGGYFSGALDSRIAGCLAGAIAAVSYSLLYLLVLSEQYALLFGSLAIFACLAAVMLSTRKLDWYAVAGSRLKSP